MAHRSCPYATLSNYGEKTVECGFKGGFPMAHPMRGKTLLITGGTGSFGRAVLGSLLGKGLKEIRIFSRDEMKQEQMRLELNNPRVKFIIGDVRSRDSVDAAMNGVDHVFHAAALKQVPS